ncbi:Retrovirus-related Pol polyprotein from transposon 297 Includes: RecName: Full=Protease [Rhizoctonia solani AG-1 IB]|uniref:RNA-directed DNA polymerase n=1 Tax=Thanatephorus cucumeris (strain AG1-IB / isolate 7/3/14) TaxID=1108050 RepID=M5CBG3_THACB|nr:Retrovirus-related Pol polyprotein from transposon 297 Includes: RecName: Full=Protease [Rhizoctonia solani AG-1 IB]
MLIPVLLDTGASRNFVHPETVATAGLTTQQLNKPVKFTDINGVTSTVTRYCKLELERRGEKFKITALVHPIKVPAKVIVGITDLAEPKIEQLASAEELKIPEHLTVVCDVFDPKRVPLVQGGTHFTIETTGPLPAPAKPYPVSAQHKEEEKKQLQELLSSQRIRHAQNPVTAAPAFFVKKQCKNCHQLRCTCGKRDHEWRWVIDYRKLNAVTPQDPFPLPNIPATLDKFARYARYTKLDLDVAFHTFPIAEADKHKTAFVTDDGIYEFNVMPFGVKNAPAMLQRTMNRILAKYPWCTVYMDDILIGADNSTELKVREILVMKELLNYGFRVKLRKCRFDVSTVDHLGFILAPDGVRPDKDKTAGIRDFPMPTTKRDVQAFLGLTNYYRAFVPNYSAIAVPLTDMTKKDAPSDFPGLTGNALKAFDTLRLHWDKPNALAPYDPDQPVTLITDASDEAYGIILEQGGRPLVFSSGKFTATERNWTVTDRELFACVQAHKRFGYMLQGQVEWHTDHKALEALRGNLADTPRRVRWREFLEPFPFVIKYVPGETMKADAMTRHSAYEGGFGAIRTVLDEDRFGDYGRTDIERE